MSNENNINLSKPRFDQSSYMGRVKHFALLTNPLNLLASNNDLEEAQNAVNQFKQTKVMPRGYNEDKIWDAKYLYDSAFNPHTDVKVYPAGRMSALIPINSIITTGMLAFYKTKPALMFWQFANQTFGTFVNYSNGPADLTATHMFKCFCASFTGAILTTIYFSNKVKNVHPIYGRLAPLAGVCIGNFINIPLTRYGELEKGLPVYGPGGVLVGDSITAAQKGILLVCLSRCLMAVPPMTMVPFLTRYAVKRDLFCHWPKMVIPYQFALVAIFTTIATPLCWAIFEQRDKISLDNIEEEIKAVVNNKFKGTQDLYYNLRY